MVNISIPDTRYTFTSGKGHGTTFRLYAEGDDLTQYETLKIVGELQEYQGEADNPLKVELVIEYVSRAEKLPATVYLPESATKLQPAFQVYRGHLHPGEPRCYDVELTVYGDTEDDWEELGSATAKLQG